MYKKIIKSTIIAFLAIAIAGCNDKTEMSTHDLEVSAVERLYDPGSGEVLLLTATAEQHFEWEPARAADGGMVSYEVIFDKTNGDFSEPIFRQVSNENGKATSATISHKTLNSIAAKAGIEAEQEGSFKWTVVASKGGPIAPLGIQINILTVKRLAGFAELPEAVYVTGTATEAGADIANAMVMKQVADGEFEIFTRLTGGASYNFVDSRSSETRRTFYTDGSVVKEGTTNTSVSETGIYHIYLDFTTGGWSIRSIQQLALFINSSQQLVVLDYVGNGVWERLNFTPNSDGDDRYKFRMWDGTAPDLTRQSATSEWRSFSPNDSRPGPNPNANWYWMREVIETPPIAQWTNNQIWKAPWDNAWPGEQRNWNFAPIDVRVILSADVPNYTHSLIIR